MSSTKKKLSLDQELTAAVAIVRIGLDRIRDAATRTADIAPHAAALQAIHDHRDPDKGVLAAVADVIGTITVSLTEVDDDRIDRVAELLDEAQAYAQDGTGDRIDRAMETLAPLLPVCEERGEQSQDAEVCKLRAERDEARAVLEVLRARVDDAGSLMATSYVREALLPTCEECGQKKPDVKVMPDPFSKALYPEETDHRHLPLCESCAIARFEES